MPTDKGAALNQRVWMLFEKAGFNTKPNSSEPDAEALIGLPSEKKEGWICLQNYLA